jgi:hypothetical protein
MRVEHLKRSETQMTRRKPEQIVKLLRKADEEMTKGKSVEDFCLEEQISPATYPPPGKATACLATFKAKVPPQSRTLVF